MAKMHSPSQYQSIARHRAWRRRCLAQGLLQREGATRHRPPAHGQHRARQPMAAATPAEAECTDQRLKHHPTSLYSRQQGRAARLHPGCWRLGLRRPAPGAASPRGRACAGIRCSMHDSTPAGAPLWGPRRRCKLPTAYPGLDCEPAWPNEARAQQSNTCCQLWWTPLSAAPGSGVSHTCALPRASPPVDAACLTHGRARRRAASSSHWLEAGARAAHA